LRRATHRFTGACKTPYRDASGPLITPHLHLDRSLLPTAVSPKDVLVRTPLASVTDARVYKKGHAGWQSHLRLKALTVSIGAVHKHLFHQPARTVNRQNRN